MKWELLIIEMTREDTWLTITYYNVVNGRPEIDGEVKWKTINEVLNADWEPISVAINDRSNRVISFKRIMIQ